MINKSTLACAAIVGAFVPLMLTVANGTTAVISDEQKAAAAAELELRSKTLLVPAGFERTTGVTYSEMCYDGVVYIVTDKGGITPKIRNQIANTPYYGCELTK